MIAGHPHTVRTSRVPLYLQGVGFGQDDSGLIDTSSYVDPGVIVDTTQPYSLPDNYFINIPTGSQLNLQPTSYTDPTKIVNTLGPGLNQNQQDIANLYAGAVASGVMTPAQATSAAAAQIAQAAAAVAKSVGPSVSPAPRVAVPAVPQSSIASALTAATVIPGVPNIALLIGGGILLMAMGKR